MGIFDDFFVHLRTIFLSISFISQRVSREKVRQVMMAKGLWKLRRFRKEAHFWRERKHRLGEMIKMDGSHHDWLEGRGPRMAIP